MKVQAAVIAIKFILKLLPMKTCNCIHVIRQQCGSFTAKRVFQYGKHQLKMSELGFFKNLQTRKVNSKIRTI